MPNRRPHTKSRHGCVRCKQKHIKCDEARPACGACARYQRCIQVNVAQPYPVTVTSANADEAARSRSSIAIWEFELLHHWIIEVADSFAISPGFHRAWRDQAITAATQYEFFMHMILILSALHLALTNSHKFTEKLRAFILGGCSEAMPAFQREAQSISDSNCVEIQAFPFLVAVYGLALAQFDRVEKSEDTVLDETIHIINLIKANKTISATTHPIVRSRSGGRWVVEEDIALRSGDPPGHSELVKAVQSLQAWIDESGAEEEEIRATNSRAATMLTQPATYPLKRNLRPFVWPNLVEDEFLGLLTARNPTALIVLAHYAVILDQTRAQWWCTNWGARIVSVVRSCLPERFIPAIAYPLEAIRML